MPEFGLPEGLSTLLGTLVDKNKLKGWSIYDDRGSITVKIRFHGENANSKNGHNGGQHQTFKAKSTAQSNRDYKRSNKYHSEKRVTRSQTLQKEKESIRGGHFVDNSGEVGVISSPLKPDPDSQSLDQDNSISLLSPVDTQASHSQPAAYVMFSSPKFGLTPPITRAEPLMSSDEPDLPCITLDGNNTQDLSSIDSNVTDPTLPPGCTEVECVYMQSGRENTGVRLFKCNKCKDIICEKCKTDGAHKGHRKYMVPWEGD